MAYTTIDDPSEYFHIQLYTGNASDDRDITNDANAGNFKPDWLWIKERNDTSSHQLIDSNRGARYAALSDSTNAEDDDQNRVQAFNTDGFQVGTASTVNENNKTYVAWQWKCNGGSASASGSESGNNVAYSRQTNTTAGFSIITYTGIGTSSSGSPVVPHGLGVVPDMLIIKNRSSNSTDWAIWFKIENPAGTNVFQGFDTGAHGGSDGASHFGDVAPNSTNISLGATPGSGDTASNRTNTDGDNYVMYAFNSVKGYSKFGQYVGNGNADGPYIHLGFKPRFIMIKGVERTSSWFLIDSARDINSLGAANTDGSADAQHQQIFADAADAESTYNSSAGDFLANGYKLRGTNASTNTNGEEFVYMAFAENPFVSSKGTPTTAR